MVLTKKQVKGLINFLPKNDVRKVLTTASIEVFEGKVYLVATDYFAIAMLEMDDVTLADLEEKVIKREELVKWHATAGKDEMLSADTIRSMASVPLARFPGFRRVIPAGNAEPTAQTTLGVNYKYLRLMRMMSGHDEHPIYKLYDGWKMVYRGTSGIYAIAQMGEE